MNNYIISFIGTGDISKRVEGANNKFGYDCLEYSDGKSCTDNKHHLVVNAAIELLGKQGVQINKMIVFGTNKSSWDALVLDKDLQKDVSNFLNPVSPKYEKIDKDYVESLQESNNDSDSGIEYKFCFMSKEERDAIYPIHDMFHNEIETILRNEKEKDFTIYLDITHGFRTDPMSLQQTLTLFAEELEGHIKILYGQVEYNSEENADEGTIKYLDDYWKNSNIFRYINIFKKNFSSGMELKNYILEYSQDIAQWIEDFSYIIRFNYTMQIDNLYHRLENLKKNTVWKKNPPAWCVNFVESFLFGELLIALGKGMKSNDTPKLFLNFAKLLEDHKLRCQSIITLHESIKAKFIVYYYTKEEKLSMEDLDNKIGNYKVWEGDKKNNINGIKEEFREFIKANRGWKTLNKWDKLSKIRNQSAHATGAGWKCNPTHILESEITEYKDMAMDIFGLLDKAMK